MILPVLRPVASDSNKQGGCYIATILVRGQQQAWPGGTHRFSGESLRAWTMKK